jgi:arylsulfatase A-like enzyme
MMTSRRFPAACFPKGTTPMNVILVILDSLRTDHMGCYADRYEDGGRAQTPHLDRLAKASLRFTRAASESLPTLPTRRAIHTGQRVWPFWQSGNQFKGDFLGAPGWGPIGEDQDTLAELLAAGGYRTAFVTDTYHQFKPSKNFHRGFQEWQWIRGQECDLWRSGPPLADDILFRHIPRKLRTDKQFVERHRQFLRNVSGWKTEEDTFPAQVFRTAADWLRRNEDARKFFLVVDSFDPHEPWNPPAKYRELYTDDTGVTDVIWLPYGTRQPLSEREIRRARANYAGEVTLVDRWFGHFYDTFLADPRADDTLFIMTTDHGHYLGDRKLFGKMGYPLLPAVLDTPILLRHPKGLKSGKSDAGLVYHPDISATVLDACGVKPRQPLDGVSLLGAFRGKTPRRDHTLTGWGPFVAIRTDRWYYNASLWGHRPLLFDLRKDPECRRNVARGNRRVLLDMHAIGQKECGGRYPQFLREQADASLPGCTPLGKW